jgi:transcriptional regulator with XRE-family HTH domain
MALIVRDTAEWEAEIGRRLKRARKDRGLTQAQLAAAANVSTSAIKSLEAGRGSTLRTLIGALRALDLDEAFDRTFAAAPSVDPMALLRARDARGRS